jgi:hypothetical protein
MGTTVDKVGRAGPEVQKSLSRLLSRLRRRNIPNWMACISAAQEGKVRASKPGLIRIRNAALLNLSRVSGFLKQGGRVKLEDWKELERDMLFVISSVTQLMEKLGSEGETSDEMNPSPDRLRLQVTSLDLRDQAVRRDLGIDIEPDKDLP